MIKRGNIRFIKSINKQSVLNIIRQNAFISTPQLVKLTGLRPSTILAILNSLLNEQLIVEAGKGDSTNKGGKRPLLWKLNENHSYAMGIDVEMGQLRGVILNLCGHVIHRATLDTQLFFSVTELVQHIELFIKDMLLYAHISLDHLKGIGIACSGVVDRENGVLIISELCPEINAPLLTELNKKFDLPIIIENNANACAQGLKWLGVSKNHKNSLTILVEFDQDVAGIGLGIIINNELYHGSTYCAGELNVHLPKFIDIIENIRHRFHESPIFSEYITFPEKLNIEMMIEAAKQGDPLAMTFFSILGNIIGKHISNAIAVLNPEALIISGKIAELGEKIIKPIQRVIELETLSITNNHLSILCDENGSYSVAKGSASLILNDFFRFGHVNA